MVKCFKHFGEDFVAFKPTYELRFTLLINKLVGSRIAGISLGYTCANLSLFSTWNYYWLLFTCSWSPFCKDFPKQENMFLFFNGAPPPSLLFIFDFFYKQELQFLQQINANKCPPSIPYRDLDPQSSEHESASITTRPGLPPKYIGIVICM